MILKKEIRQKICAVALAAVMLTGTAAAGMAVASQAVLPVLAASVVSENGFECRQVGDDGFLIVKYTGTDADVVIPETVGGRTVEGIGSKAFDGCHFIKNITFSKTTCFVYGDAFNNCTNLQKVFVDADNPYYSSVKGCLTSKDQKTLYMCPAGYRGKFTVPTSIKTIQAFAFQHCTHITELIVPKGVKTLQSGAFLGCTALKRVSIDSTVAFDDTIGDLAYAFRACIRLTEIEYHSADGRYDTVDGVLFCNNYGEKSLLLYPQGKQGAYAVPAGVTTINDRAFSSSSLTQINIPKSVKCVGRDAFKGCDNLVSVTFEPGSKMGTDAWEAFSSCPNLQTLKLPKSFDNVSSAGESNNIVTNSPNVTIYGKTGSYAEQYAKEYGIPFSTAVPKLKNNATMSRASVKLGGTIEVLHEGIDGKGPYEVAVYYKKASSDKWTKAHGYRTAETTSIQPKAAVKYDVKVLLKDTRGKVITKYLTFSVTR